MVETAHMQWKITQLGKMLHRMANIFCVIWEIDVAKSISGDKCTTRNRINAFTVHAQILLWYLKHAALDRLQVRLNAILFKKSFGLEIYIINNIVQYFLLGCLTSSLANLGSCILYLLFCQLPSALTEWNSAKTSYMFRSECNWKCMSKIWGVLSP